MNPLFESTFRVRVFRQLLPPQPTIHMKPDLCRDIHGSLDLFTLLGTIDDTDEWLQDWTAHAMYIVISVYVAQMKFKSGIRTSSGASGAMIILCRWDPDARVFQHLSTSGIQSTGGKAGGIQLYPREDYRFYSAAGWQLPVCSTEPAEGERLSLLWLERFQPYQHLITLQNKAPAGTDPTGAGEEAACNS